MGRAYSWAEATAKQKRFIGRLIHEARLARDLTPREAAKQAKVHRSTFYRWERGDIGSTTVLVLDWLLHDPNDTHDAFYWRERAIAAEETLAGIERKLTQYREDKDGPEHRRK